MTTIDKLRNLARELAGEAWDYDRRHLVAQAHVRREAAVAVMQQADMIRREDAIFENPGDGTRLTRPSVGIEPMEIRDPAWRPEIGVP